uniref:Serine/arginine-rich splicing factor RS2Z33 isoform X3 n=1 Tax=Rhizophora mucronata TaxID=61149 RepID=A0A2P2M7V0_RHIMU
MIYFYKCFFARSMLLFSHAHCLLNAVDVVGVTLDHLVDHALLGVGEAEAQVTAEVAVTVGQDLHCQRESEVLTMKVGHSPLSQRTVQPPRVGSAAQCLMKAVHGRLPSWMTA